eukprot:5527241-Prorocentrum_lima.AAC.1
MGTYLKQSKTSINELATLRKRYIERSFQKMGRRMAMVCSWAKMGCRRPLPASLGVLLGMAMPLR